MQQKSTILSKTKGSVATITLNRPEFHNAMDITLIRELTESIKAMEVREKIRFILLNAEGSDFCSGADLNWMREGMNQTRSQLKSESLELADLYKTMWDSELTILSAVQGKVIGGGNGLLAASDIVVAEETASFAISEVKLGLIPATIAPYVLHKIGFSRTVELMLSGRTFDAKEARSAGHVHYLCETGTLKETTDAILSNLLTNGPDATKGIKKLLRRLGADPSGDQIKAYTADLIARFRTSPEGQEGIIAFLEKRNPGWYEAT